MNFLHTFISLSSIKIDYYHETLYNRHLLVFPLLCVFSLLIGLPRIIDI